MDGTWVDAGELTAGDTVVSFDGNKGILANGTVTNVERVAEPQTMYNLTVDEAHTFFVGEGEWLVHNTGNAANCLDWERVARLTTNYDVFRSEVAIKTPFGSGDIDIVVNDGGITRLGEVGGLAKGNNLGKFGLQLKKLQYYANQHGGVPTFFYDSNTPQNVVDFAEQRLGRGNVIPIPPKNW